MLLQAPLLLKFINETAKLSNDQHYCTQFEINTALSDPI